MDTVEHTEIIAAKGGLIVVRITMNDPNNRPLRVQPPGRFQVWRVAGPGPQTVGVRDSPDAAREMLNDLVLSGEGFELENEKLPEDFLENALAPPEHPSELVQSGTGQNGRIAILDEINEEAPLQLRNRWVSVTPDQDLTILAGAESPPIPPAPRHRHTPRGG